MEITPITVINWNADNADLSRDHRVCISVVRGDNTEWASNQASKVTESTKENSSTKKDWKKERKLTAQMVQ